MHTATPVAARAAALTAAAVLPFGAVLALAVPASAATATTSTTAYTTVVDAALVLDLDDLTTIVDVLGRGIAVTSQTASDTGVRLTCTTAVGLACTIDVALDTDGSPTAAIGVTPTTRTVSWLGSAGTAYDVLLDGVDLGTVQGPSVVQSDLDDPTTDVSVSVTAVTATTSTPDAAATTSRTSTSTSTSTPRATGAATPSASATPTATPAATDTDTEAWADETTATDGNDDATTPDDTTTEGDDSSPLVQSGGEAGADAESDDAVVVASGVSSDSLAPLGFAGASAALVVLAGIGWIGVRWLRLGRVGAPRH